MAPNNDTFFKNLIQFRIHLYFLRKFHKTKIKSKLLLTLNENKSVIIKFFKI